MTRMTWLMGALASAGFLLGGCQGSSSSDVNVFNGSETSQYDGSVVRLLVDQGRRRFCTGVVVDANTVLMAAHCIKSSTVETSILAELRVGKEGLSEIKAKRYYSWSVVRNMETLTDEAAARDLAVVVFEGAPFNGPYLKLASHVAKGKSADLNTAVKIVGFGAANFGLNAGTTKGRGAQVGENRISAAKSGLYILTADLSSSAPTQGNAAAAAGDAGGPLLNVKGELLGVGAGIRLLKKDKATPTGVTEDGSKYAAPRPDEAAYAENSFVDLSSEMSKKLLGFAIGAEKKFGHDVKIAYIDAESGSAQTVAAPKEVTFSPDDTSWLSDPNKDRTGDWVAASGRFVEAAAPESGREGLGLVQASASASSWGSPGGSYSKSCIGPNNCKESGGPGATSAFTSMSSGGMGGGDPFSRSSFGNFNAPPFNMFGPGMMQPAMPPTFAQMSPGFGGRGPTAAAGWGAGGPGASFGAMQVSSPGGMFGGPGVGQPFFSPQGMGFSQGPFGQRFGFDPDFDF